MSACPNGFELVAASPYIALQQHATISVSTKRCKRHTSSIRPAWLSHSPVRFARALHIFQAARKTQHAGMEFLQRVWQDPFFSSGHQITYGPTGSQLINVSYKFKNSSMHELKTRPPFRAIWSWAAWDWWPNGGLQICLTARAGLAAFWPVLNFSCAM